MSNSTKVMKIIDRIHPEKESWKFLYSSLCAYREIISPPTREVIWSDSSGVVRIKITSFCLRMPNEAFNSTLANQITSKILQD